MLPPFRLLALLAIVLPGSLCVDKTMLNSARLSSESKCAGAINIFSNSHSEFQRCAVQYVVPVYFCQKCVQRFIDSTKAWDNLDNTLDEHEQSCMLKFVDHDRLNLLRKTRETALKLWSDAACSNCFVNIDDQVTATQTNDTQEFYKLYNTTADCLDLNNDVCTECAGDYLSLNNFYIEQLQRSHGEADGVCYDLRDAMNRTRFAWSKTYGCCQDRHDSLVAFVLCSAVVASLPVLFYGAAVWHRLRTERRDQPLLNAHSETDVGESAPPGVGAGLPGVAPFTHTREANDPDDDDLASGGAFGGQFDTDDDLTQTKRRLKNVSLGNGVGSAALAPAERLTNTNEPEPLLIDVDNVSDDEMLGAVGGQDDDVAQTKQRLKKAAPHQAVPYSRDSDDDELAPEGDVKMRTETPAAVGDAKSDAPAVKELMEF